MAARLRVNYRNGQPPDEITLGAFAQIAAKRHSGIDAIKADDPEALIFGCFVEIKGPQFAKKPDAFDTWLLDVEDWELIEKADGPEDPPPAETPTDSSLASPPTSE